MSAEGSSSRPGDALRYDAVVDLSDENNAHTQLVLLTGEGGRVLEIGPATGYITAALKRRGCRVTAIEIDPVAARKAEVFAERVIIADVEELDFEVTFGPDDRFDVALFGDVLEHLKDPGRVLRAVRRLLTDDGRVVASIPNVAHGSIRLSLLTGEFTYLEQGLLDRTHLRLFTKTTIEELFSAADYRVVAWRSINVDPFGTEHALDERRFPPQLIEAVRSDPSCLAFQYVVSAVPTETPEHMAPSYPISIPLEALHELQREADRFRALKDSLSFQLLTRVAAIIARIFPPNSGRRRFYSWLKRLVRRYLGPAARTTDSAPRRDGRAIRDPTGLRKELTDFLSRPDSRIFLLSSDDPLVSVLVVTFNKAEHTLQCLRSLAEERSVPFEVIVVDNASSDETGALLARLEGATILRNEQNLHFIQGTNQAAAASRGKYLLLLNNDAYLQQGALRALVGATESRPDVGAVGAQLVWPDGRLQEAGSILCNDASAFGYGRGDDPDRGPYRYRREVDFCSAACLLVRRDLWDRLGGFDSRYEPAYYEDVDLCMGLRSLGYRTLYEPRARVIHNEYTSSDPDNAISLMRRNQPAFAEKWGMQLESQFEPSEKNVLKARDRRAGDPILVLDDRVPAPRFGSGFPRMFVLLRLLSESDHRVTYVPMQDPTRHEPETQMLEELGIEILVEPSSPIGLPDLARIIKERRDHYVTTIVSRPHNAAAAIPLLRRLSPRTTIICDAEAVFYRREEMLARLTGRNPNARAIKRMRDGELELISAADKVLAVSEEEIRTIVESGGRGDHIFVWGHPSEPVTPRTPYAGRIDLLFVGGFLHSPSPNEDAIVHFVNAVFPRIRAALPGVGLRIVGHNPPRPVRDLASPVVSVLGFAPDLGQHYESCRIFVNPIRYAAGIALKTVEAMAHGIPVVTSDVGARGLGIRDGDEALVADSDDEFANAVIHLYQDEQLWYGLQEGALALVERRFHPKRLEAELVRILEEPVQKPKRPTSITTTVFAFRTSWSRLPARAWRLYRESGLRAAAGKTRAYLHERIRER